MVKKNFSGPSNAMHFGEKCQKISLLGPKIVAEISAWTQKNFFWKIDKDQYFKF